MLDLYNWFFHIDCWQFDQFFVTNISDRTQNKLAYKYWTWSCYVMKCSSRQAVIQQINNKPISRQGEGKCHWGKSVRMIQQILPGQLHGEHISSPCKIQDSINIFQGNSRNLVMNLHRPGECYVSENYIKMVFKHLVFPRFPSLGNIDQKIEASIVKTTWIEIQVFKLVWLMLESSVLWGFCGEL